MNAVGFGCVVQLEFAIVPDPSAGGLVHETRGVSFTKIPPLNSPANTLHYITTMQPPVKSIQVKRSTVSMHKVNLMTRRESRFTGGSLHLQHMI